MKKSGARRCGPIRRIAPGRFEQINEEPDPQRKMPTLGYHGMNPYRLRREVIQNGT